VGVNIETVGWVLRLFVI